jgi:ATP-dependent helicase/nuclease subunit B
VKRGESVEALVDEALAGLERLIAAFDDPATPYLASPRDDRALRFSDYDHLARRPEWARADGEASE